MENDILKKDKTPGIWIKYKRGSDYLKLSESVKGYNTDWAIEKESTAKEQLSGRDFYIYYLRDDSGEYKEPCILIRMNKHNEVDFVDVIYDDKDFNNKIDIIKETCKKLKELPYNEKYLQRVYNTLYFADIYRKFKNNIELNQEEIKSLYDHKPIVHTFGYYFSKKIDEIKESRDYIKDLQIIYECSEYQIAKSMDDLNENTVVYLGDLKYEGNEVYFPKLKYISGDADFKDLISIPEGGLSSLELIGRDANFYSLTSAKGLENLKIIGKDANFGSLITSEGLESLEEIRWDARFGSLKDATGLKSLKIVEMNANFSDLVKSEGLESLKEVGNGIYLWSLESASNLKSLQCIYGYAGFSNLKSSEGLDNLKYIGGDASFGNLTNAEHLTSLRDIGGDAFFQSLRSAKGLENLEDIGQSAYFDSLISGKELKSLWRIIRQGYFPLIEPYQKRRIKKLTWNCYPDDDY